MKYINSARNVCINDYNILVATKGPLTSLQKEKLDSVFGTAEILSFNNYVEFKDFVDYKNTRFLNLKKIEDNIENTINIPSPGEVKEILFKQFDKSKYSFTCFNMYENIKNSIPDRFKKLGLNISYFFKIFEADANKSCRPLSGTDKGGLFYWNKNKVEVAFPVLIFDKKIKEYDTNLLSSLYFDSSYILIHELKHAFNHHNFINTLKHKKISPYDYLRFFKYDEYSAEMEKIFYYINTREMNKKGLSIFKYKRFEKYVDSHPNYFENLPEFVNFVKHDLEETFFKFNSHVYTEDYYLENVAEFIRTFPNYFSNKSDDGVYEALKKNSLSFEIFNPKKGKVEVVDLSSYFKDEDLSSKEKYILDKLFRKVKNAVRELKKETSISNKTLKILANELDMLIQK